MLRSFKAAGLLSVAAVLLAALTGLAAETATAAAGGDTVTACESAGTTGMTAKLVVSSAETVSGVVVDAAGCDIGIYVGPGASNAVIEDDTVTGANDHGVLVQDVADVTVRDNRIVHNGVAKKSGLGEDKALTLLGTTGAVVEGNLVSDNVGDGGISVNDDGGSVPSAVPTPGADRPALDNVISGNTVVGNLGGCGIVVSAYNPAGGVIGNEVIDNIVAGTPGVLPPLSPPVTGSIVVAADLPATVASRNTVSGNLVTGSFIAGVIVHSNAPGDRVSGTTIVNNTLAWNDWGHTDGPPTAVGIVVASGSANASTPSVLADTVIAGNRIDHQDIGIWISQAVGTHVGGRGLNHATIPVQWATAP